jgi:ActR/RegA family two-component response regulator
MNTVLIIEDDDFKAKSLKEYMLNRSEFDTVEIASSLVEAIDAITIREYNFILVDMAIPSHPTIPGEGAPVSLLTGGLDILMELSDMNRTDPCVIVTQYGDIEIAGQYYSLEQAKFQIEKQLECSVLSCIEYKEADDKWKESLKDILDNI